MSQIVLSGVSCSEPRRRKALRSVVSSHVFTNSQMHSFTGREEVSAAFKIVCTLRLRLAKPHLDLITGNSR